MLFLILQKKIFFLLESRRRGVGHPGMLMVINVVRQLEPQGRRRCTRLQLHPAVRCEAVDVFRPGNHAEGLGPIRVHAVEGTRFLSGMKRAGISGALEALEVGALVGARVGVGAGVVAAGVAGRVDGPAGTVIADSGIALNRGLHSANRAAAAVVGLLLHHAAGAWGEDNLVVATGSARGRSSARSAGGVGRRGVGPFASRGHRPEQGGEHEEPLHWRPPFAQARQSREG